MRRIKWTIPPLKGWPPSCLACGADVGIVWFFICRAVVFGRTCRLCFSARGRVLAMHLLVGWIHFLRRVCSAKVGLVLIERGHALGLVGFVQAEEGDVDDFVFERASVLTFYTFQQRTAVEATTACGYQPALGAALC